MAEKSPITRTLFALGAELISAAFWAVIDAESLAANAYWLTGVGFAALMTAWFWDQIVEFRNWKRGDHLKGGNTLSPHLQARMRYSKRDNSHEVIITLKSLDSKEIRILDHRIKIDKNADWTSDPITANALPPGGEISLIPRYTFSECSPRLVVLEVRILYIETGLFYLAKYTFLAEKGRNVAPTRSSCELAEGRKEEESASQLAEAFKKEQGTLILAIPRINRKGLVTVFMVRERGKVFIYNASEGFIVFEAQRKGYKEVLRVNLPDGDESTIDTVTLSWGFDGHPTHLLIDDKIFDEPTIVQEMNL